MDMDDLFFTKHYKTTATDVLILCYCSYQAALSSCYVLDFCKPKDGHDVGFCYQPVFNYFQEASTKEKSRLVNEQDAKHKELEGAISFLVTD